MSGIFVGINGLARKIEKMYVGLNGKAKLIEKCYVGINGKARIVFNSIENSSGGFSITYSDGSTIFYDCGENITSDFLSENGFYQNEQTGYFDFSDATSIEIHNGVTTIEEGIFTSLPKVTSLYLPRSLSSLGSFNFTITPLLTTIKVDPNNTTYDSRNNCNAVIETATNKLIIGCRNTIIPDGVTCIGDSVFSYCDSLTTVTIPSSVTSIGDNVFDGCTSLSSINISDGITSIGRSAFMGCTSLTSITIPGSVTSIGAYAFNKCNSLSIVNVNSVTPPELKYEAYYGVKNFYGTSNTLKIYVPSSAVDTYKTADGWSTYTNKIVGYSLILTKTDGTVEYRTSSDVTDDKSVIESVILAPGTTSVSGWQFYNCSSLTSITIPNSVTKIEEAAISYCSSLTSITIPNSVTSLDTEAFSGCRSLTSITIPSSVKSVGIYAFSHCKSLVSVVIKDGITNLGSSAFSDCPQLTTVTLETVTPPSTDEWLFTDCSSLSSIYVPSSAVDTYKTADGWSEYADKIVGY